MHFKKTKQKCLNCGQSEDETPLLFIRYLEEDLWICSQCLPGLIHAPQKMKGKLKNAEQIKRAAHHEH